MTVPFIPAIDPTVLEALPKLVDTIGEIAMPYRKAELALAETARTDPAALQQIADFAAQNPEAIASVFGPNAAQFITKIPESAQSRLARTQATLAQGLTTLSADALAALPPEQREQYGRIGIANTVAGMNPSDVTNEQQTQQVQSAYQHYEQANPNFNPLEFVRNFRTGKVGTDNKALVDLDVFSGALQSPRGAAIKALFDYETEKEQLAAQERIRNAASQNDYNFGLRSSLDEAARALVVKYPNTSFNEWRSYISDDNYKKKADELARLPAEEAANLSAEDQNLRKIGLAALNVQDNALNSQALRRAGSSIAGIRSLIAREKEPTKAQFRQTLEAAVTQLNTDLSQGNSPIRARVVEVEKFGRNPYNVEYFDPQTGNTITDTDAERMVGGDTSGSNLDLTGNAKIVYDAIVAGTVKETDLAGSSLSAEDKARVRAALAARNTQRR